jgi:hypothetical protein
VTVDTASIGVDEDLLRFYGILFLDSHLCILGNMDG